MVCSVAALCKEEVPINSLADFNGRHQTRSGDLVPKIRQIEPD